MNKSMKRFLSFMMTIAVVATTVFGPDVTTALAASSSKAVKSVTLKIGSSNVTKKAKTMYVGSSATIKVTVNPSSAKKSVAFKSSNTKVATVTKAGKVSAKKAGSAKITATVTGKNGKKTITYTTIKVKNVEVKSVKLNKTNVTLNKGDKTTLKATVAPSNATVKTVKWSTSDSDVATVKNGVVTAVGKGTATIVAKSGTKSAKCTVVVTNTAEVTGIKLDVTEFPLYVKATQQLTATVEPSTAANKTVKWLSSNDEVASVSPQGLVTGNSEGTAVITATTEDGSYSASATVTVTIDTSNNVANLSISVANSMANYENTVLTGTNADIKVLVTNSVGKPLGNTSVTLTIDPQYGNASNVFGITGDNNNYTSAKVTTDANGYADFTIGEKGGYTYTSTDLKYQSYKLVATATGSNLSTESTLSFACIDLSGVEVLNNRYVSLNDIEPGENATKWDGIAGTYSTNGARTEEYVDSQKVSTKDEEGKYVDDHRVYVSATPYIVLPAKNAQTEINNYYNDNFKKESSEYLVYNDETNEDTTTWIKGVPAGLQWATLVFSDIVLSEYTILRINTYDSVSGALIKTYTMDNTNLNKNFGYQIPIQEDTAVDVEVALISEGQVNDDSNDGFVIDHVEGLYKTDLYKNSERVELDSTVTWSASNTYYSEYIELSLNDASKYITDSKYLSEKYKYSYSVPAFPNTGDAVIKVVDANDKLVSYFLYPTENQWQNEDGTIYPTNTDKKNITLNGKYLNKNDISLPSKYKEAVKASEEEINNVVGTVTQEGNVAIVDSEKAGRTNLMATVNIPGVTTEQLNDTNGKVLYTSVQWAPIPDIEKVEEGDNFYALASQYVTVKAQLYDKNGKNVVTTQSKNVKFTLDGEELKNPVHDVLDNNKDVTIQMKETLTNEKGQATIRFSANSSKGHVYHLSAECEGYHVKLLVGKAETESELANIYWITPGLSFTDKITKSESKDETAQIGTTTTTLDNTQEVAAIDSRKVGNHWIFGYQVVGDLDDNDDTTKKEVAKISNINVLMSKSDDTGMTMATSTEDSRLANGSALVYTEKVGSSKLIGEIASDSYVDNGSNVLFTIVDELGEKVGDYVNVGEEAPTVTAKLILTISWKESGKEASIIYPQGELLSSEESSYAYIKVVDKFGNPIDGEEVEYAITGINATNGKVKATTKNGGLVKIELPAPGKGVDPQTGSTITAVVDGTTYNGRTIYYKDVTEVGFALVGAALDATNTENPQVKLTFSSTVNKALLKKEMFSITKGSSADKTLVNYEIEKAEVGGNGNVVILTIKSKDKAIVDETGKVTVNVKSYDESTDGIEYKLVDAFGRIISSSYTTASFYPKTTYTLTATNSSDNKTVTVVLKDSLGNTVEGEQVYAYSAALSVIGGNGVKAVKTNSKGEAVFNITPEENKTSVYFFCNGASAEASVSSK